MRAAFAALVLGTLGACSSAANSPGGVAPDVSVDAGPTACQRELTARGLTFVPAPRAIERPASRPDLACVIDDPVLVEPLIRGVTFRFRQIDAAPTAMFASCPLVLAMDRLAQMLVDRNVTDVIHLGIYGCRAIAGTDMLSEHARARALDISGLRVAGGAVHTVLDHWDKEGRTPTPAGAFLRELVVSLFEGNVFTVILTPDFNAEHHDHFHLDLTPGLRLFK